ncbi:MAG: DUF2254 domain-containing protein [Balneolaceae bacterium]|nr:DUF2254 domain-containing protein [Balneolaceae bacterium]
MKPRDLNNRLKNTYHNITGSIGFYPTMMSVGFFLFAILIMSIEYLDVFMRLKQYISIVLVNGADNARLLLNTLIAGVFSLTVFSFSMVMIVLNRATATLSPRVIPGLISQKSHQFVLGFYLGTIIYSLMLTVNINSPSIEESVPGLGILISLCFGIASLGLFVYFIHSISKTIQADNILNRLYNDTRKELFELYGKHSHDHDKEVEAEEEMPDTSEWEAIESVNSGYFKMVEVSGLCRLLQEYDLKIKITIPHGFFVVEGYPFLQLNKPIDDEELADEIRSKFIFFVEEYVKDHYSYGFKQISEIAVKALSPGINDPGTAIRAIDLLTILFKIRMENGCMEFEKDVEGEARVYYRELSLDELLYKTMTPIRAYGKTDALVVMNLLESFTNMLYAQKTAQMEEVLVQHIKGIIEDAEQASFNQMDTKKINDSICQINRLINRNQKLEMLNE